MSSELKIPRHIAIIMDGNGRWAKEQGKERFEGHIEGVMAVRRTVETALDYKVSYLTIYAFSTENWGRPKEEVDALMELFAKSVVSETPDLQDKGVRVEIIGDKSGFSEEVQHSLNYIESETAAGEKMTMIIALNYSSRDEIKRAVQSIAQMVKSGEIEPSQIDERTISQALDTANYPDPDLIIRTSGESRLSNFLLWQASYSELYFPSLHWPEFDRAAFDGAIKEYSKRERRYGVLEQK